jgi:predicted DNA-binding transcriptional regulator AlpA
MNSTDELLTTAQVARLLGISPQRVRQLVQRSRQNDFPAPAEQTRTTRGVGIRRWRRSDVERWNADGDRANGRPPL